MDIYEKSNYTIRCVIIIFFMPGFEDLFDLIETLRIMPNVRSIKLTEREMIIEVYYKSLTKYNELMDFIWQKEILGLEEYFITHTISEDRCNTTDMD
ncbi:TPA: hypothetical protein HA235_04740 [Candidatus Woesearchaeota archaeon]|nr:hypothetical protein [Candidatus Woesearchaeota archaeon]HIH54761.1 hypothetical protein [Candidatus Woesearchaeota archaeon]HIJ01944.1 hypothetical protein [Candidatus Woesearchaeota archaeon]HIJ14766.1 hypothetical protein [Candidatus Woesearchaeota archaeon]